MLKHVLCIEPCVWVSSSIDIQSNVLLTINDSPSGLFVHVFLTLNYIDNVHNSYIQNENPLQTYNHNGGIHLMLSSIVDMR